MNRIFRAIHSAYTCQFEKAEHQGKAIAYAAALRSNDRNVCICVNPCGQEPCLSRGSGGHGVTAVEVIEAHTLIKVDRRYWWCECGVDCLKFEGSHAEHVWRCLQELHDAV